MVFSVSHPHVCDHDVFDNIAIHEEVAWDGFSVRVGSFGVNVIDVVVRGGVPFYLVLPNMEFSYELVEFGD